MDNMNKQLKNRTEPLAHTVLGLMSLFAIIPFILMFIYSFTDDKTLIATGYSFFPSKLSMEAYGFLWIQRKMIARAYGITVLMTVVGTTISLTITSLLAYTLSRKDFKWRKPLTFYVFFTMLFNGGLVPTYLLYAKYMGIKNSLWALLLPGLLMNGFNIMIMKTYFSTNIPEAVIESALIDGAGKARTFLSVVIPLSYPILATIGLFIGIAYWNDWYNGLIFVTDESYFNIQNLLNRILMNIQFLKSASVGSSDVASLAAKLPAVSIRMAIATIGVVPILATYPFFQKYFVKGISIGAVKG
jgi:putative aldouronate transport system permease protein